ncbi:MAG: antibiotic biosynthesis monooxygenase [Anaerolineaceae bacterium]|nr:antibiotic biosynthesis monooxygenase [Anaerolineaceae bacterium]
MIERHVSFQVLVGNEVDFENFIEAAYAPAMERQPGFRGLSLLKQEDATDTYQMVIRFEQSEDAANWRASEEHKLLSPQLKAFHSGSDLTVYTVISSRGELAII